MGQSAWLNTSQIMLQGWLAEVNRDWRLEGDFLHPATHCVYEDVLQIALLRHRFRVNRACRIVHYGLAFSQPDRYYSTLPPFGEEGTLAEHCTLQAIIIRRGYEDRRQ